MIRSSILDPEYNVLFPYKTFPWRLEVNKDCHNVKGIALTVCHFECEEHLQKYLDRYKLRPRDYKVSNRDGKSLKSSKKHKSKRISKQLEKVVTEVQVQFAEENPAWIPLENSASNSKGAKCLKKSKTEPTRYIPADSSIR